MDEKFSNLFNCLISLEGGIHNLVELSEGKEKNQDLIMSDLNNLFKLTEIYICKNKINKRFFDHNLKKWLIELVAKTESESEQTEKRVLSI